MSDESEPEVLHPCTKCGGPVVDTSAGRECRECGDRYVVGICRCDSPEVVRTMAKGTPAEKRYCQCGGRVRD